MYVLLTLNVRYEPSQWHRDTSNCPLGWERESLCSNATPPARRTVKAFIYIFDVSEGQGCTSVVRGSHRLLPEVGSPSHLFDFASAGFNEGWAGSGLGRTATVDGFAPLSLMPK